MLRCDTLRLRGPETPETPRRPRVPDRPCPAVHVWRSSSDPRPASCGPGPVGPDGPDPSPSLSGSGVSARGDLRGLGGPPDRRDGSRTNEERGLRDDNRPAQWSGLANLTDHPRGPSPVPDITRWFAISPAIRRDLDIASAGGNRTKCDDGIHWHRPRPHLVRFDLGHPVGSKSFSIDRYHLSRAQPLRPSPGPSAARRRPQAPPKRPEGLLPPQGPSQRP